MTTIFVPGLPVAQPRQRHRKAKVKGKDVMLNYLPRGHPVHAFKAAIKLAWPKSERHEGPLRLALDFHFPRAKSRTRKVNLPEPKPTKPDWDNLGKSVCDALNGVAWNDDAQVCEAMVSKRIVGDGGRVGVYITVSEMEVL